MEALDATVKRARWRAALPTPRAGRARTPEVTVPVAPPVVTLPSPPRAGPSASKGKAWERSPRLQYSKDPNTRAMLKREADQRRRAAAAISAASDKVCHAGDRVSRLFWPLLSRANPGLSAIAVSRRGRWSAASR